MKGDNENDNDSNMVLESEVLLTKYPVLPPKDDDEEWSYSMRRKMQEIVPGLYLGPYAAATRNNLDQMMATGLTHVVCATSKSEARLVRPNHSEHFEYLVVQLNDPPNELVIPIFRSVSSFIENALRVGGKVLVHGNAGMCRSAALVAAYLMCKFGVTFEAARNYLMGKRFCIHISETYSHQLWEYEPIYKAEHATSQPFSWNVYEPQFLETKRKIEEMAGSSEDDDESVPNSKIGGYNEKMDME